MTPIVNLQKVYCVQKKVSLLVGKLSTVNECITHFVFITLSSFINPPDFIYNHIVHANVYRGFCSPWECNYDSWFSFHDAFYTCLAILHYLFFSPIAVSWINAKGEYWRVPSWFIFILLYQMATSISNEQCRKTTKIFVIFSVDLHSQRAYLSVSYTIWPVISLYIL